MLLVDHIDAHVKLLGPEEFWHLFSHSVVVRNIHLHAADNPYFGEMVLINASSSKPKQGAC
jgi:hypothetical protein